MASAVLVTHEDYQRSFPGRRVPMNKTHKPSRVPISDRGQSANMVEFSNVRERNSVHMKAAGGGKGILNPTYQAASDDSSSLNRKSISLNVDSRKDAWRPYPDMRRISETTLHQVGNTALETLARVPVAEMTKEERRALRRKLKLDLEQVRGLSSKLEAKEFQLKELSQSIGANPSYSDAQFSGNVVGSCVGKEVTSGLVSTPGSLVSPFQRGIGLAHQNSFSGMDGSQVGGDPSFKEKRTPKANQLYHNAEFLVGKDKMPPSEKSKSKPHVGSKRAAHVRVDSRDSKRQTVDRVQSKQLAELMRSCGNLLKKLMGHKHGWVFNEPVDVVNLGLTDYHSIIKRPMDLGTVKGKMSRKEYSSPSRFAEDVRLTFSNAMTYNPAGHDVHSMADELRKVFEERWKAIEGKYEERLKIEPPDQNYTRQQLLQTPQQYSREEISDQSQAKPKKAPVSKKVASVKPKPKSKSKRDMTFQEKKKLSGNLQLLPPDKLEYIVQLMKERNPNLSQKDDEIEVDIDTFDNDTLWELNRYVTNCMKSMGKNKKKVEQNQSLKSQSIADGVGENLNKGRKGELGDEDVDIDDDLPHASFPPVVIDKDGGYLSRSSSSGSSSSDSGSSSDSDSGSSSDSESEADDAQSAGKRG